MCFFISLQTTGLLGNAAGKRHGMENPDGLLGKVTMGKSRATSAAQRAPLGNISNRTTGQNVQKKVGLQKVLLQTYAEQKTMISKICIWKHPMGRIITKNVVRSAS